MVRSRILQVLALTAVGTAVLVGQAFSQEGPPRGGRGGRDPEQMRQRREQFRQRMEERMKEMLGVNDEEWKVLQPRIEKVQTLSREARGGMGFRMFGRGRRGRGGEQGPQREQSEIEKKMSDLQKVLENKDATPEQIKTNLTAYRTAREKVQKDLEKAQKDLREIVTVRQEAQLVLMGVLE